MSGTQAHTRTAYRNSGNLAGAQLRAQLSQSFILEVMQTSSAMARNYCRTELYSNNLTKRALKGLLGSQRAAAAFAELFVQLQILLKEKGQKRDEAPTSALASAKAASCWRRLTCKTFHLQWQHKKPMHALEGPIRNIRALKRGCAHVNSSTA